MKRLTSHANIIQLFEAVKPLLTMARWSYRGTYFLFHVLVFIGRYCPFSLLDSAQKCEARLFDSSQDGCVRPSESTMHWK